VFLADDGPEEWRRIEEGGTPPARPVAPVEVSDIEEGDDRISFDVDRPGSPVLVKASYFPNWQADGAEGPWRVTPNLMVVIPTSEHVELRYGQTPVDLGAWMVTLLGLAGLAVLAVRGRVHFGDPDEGDPDEGDPDEDGEPSDRSEPFVATSAGREEPAEPDTG
jgi:hypothetical protein